MSISEVKVARRKQCTKCKQTKPFSAFYKAANQKPGYRCQCKACMTKNKRESYARNPAKRKVARKKYRAEHPEKTIADRKRFFFRGSVVNMWLKRQAGGKCSRCGFDEVVLLHWHHIDPSTKDATVKFYACSPKNFHKVVAEAKKCVLLCPNCHRQIHLFSSPIINSNIHPLPDDIVCMYKAEGIDLLSFKT